MSGILLRRYIADNSPRPQRAVAKLRVPCEARP